MNTTHHFFATCARGTERALRNELLGLGITSRKGGAGGVRLSGSFDDGMRACLWSRIASRVLLELGSAPAADAEELFQGGLAIPWEELLDPDQTFSVRATVRESMLTHSHFIALKVKDAVVDRIREKRGRRPSVNTRQPDLSISVHLDEDEASFYLDMAGEPLHRRGWRSRGGAAPLKESLAAAVLAIGGYEPSLPLCDPMCGSGTLAIEAAMIARRMAPGMRRGFAFERWPNFGRDQRAAWRAMREEARELELERAPAGILCRDGSEDAVETSRRNAERAKVSEDLSFEVADARTVGDISPNCQVFSNPPYGERLGRRRLQLEGLYRQLGEAWLSHPLVSKIVLLGATSRLEECLGRRATKHHELFNGPIRCRLLTYEIAHVGASDGLGDTSG